MASFREKQIGRRRKTGQEHVGRSPEEWQQLCSEFNICKRKLQAKSEALLVLAKELDNVRQEKDAYKLMAEQLREKFHSQRRKYEERERALGLSLHDGDPLAERKNHTLVQILCELRKKNRKTELELEDVLQKLSEAEGDIKLLRESIARQRVGDEGIGKRLFPAHEREELIRQLEKSREQIESLERDMVAKIDEHQEFVTERDYYRTKTERLNQELNYVLGGDDRRIVDVDALVMENKYLKEKISQYKEEKASLLATTNKYKAALERRKGKGTSKFGSSGGAVLSTKDVESLLAQGKSSGLSPSPASLGDLQSLASSLLETVHDKNMALQHQKNTNKILGQRVAELEKKLKTLEVAGLWNLPVGAGFSGRSTTFLAQERESMASGLKTLLPHQVSTSSDDVPRSLEDCASSMASSAKSTPHSTPSHSSEHSSSHHLEPTGRDTGSSLILLEEGENVGEDISVPRSHHCQESEAAQWKNNNHSSSIQGRDLTRRDTGSSLILLEGQEEEDWLSDSLARSRSHSSPSHPYNLNEVVSTVSGDQLLEDCSSVDKDQTRSRSVSSPSRANTYQQRELLGQDASEVDHVSVEGDVSSDGQAETSQPEDKDKEMDERGFTWRYGGDNTKETSNRAKQSLTDDLNDDDTEEGGLNTATATSERELLMNIYEIERGQADCSKSEGYSASTTHCDEDELEDHDRGSAVYRDSCEDEDVHEDDESIAADLSNLLGAGGEDDVSSISAGSLENLFDSVTDKFSLKSRERRLLEGKESTQPSSPLLRKEKQPNLVVIDNTPQCV